MARADLAEKERELMVSQLQVLRAQVEPYFLWNPLANVEYLMRTDITKAHLMMKHLTGYLRGALTSDVDKLNTLGAKFRSIQSYVGLMQFRMGDRLQAQLDLPEELANVPFRPWCCRPSSKTPPSMAWSLFRARQSWKSGPTARPTSKATSWSRCRTTGWACSPLRVLVARVWVFARCVSASGHSTELREA